MSENKQNEKHMVTPEIFKKKDRKRFSRKVKRHVVMKVKSGKTHNTHRNKP